MSSNDGLSAERQAQLNARSIAHLLPTVNESLRLMRNTMRVAQEDVQSMTMGDFYLTMSNFSALLVKSNSDVLAASVSLPGLDDHDASRPLSAAEMDQLQVLVFENCATYVLSSYSRRVLLTIYSRRGPSTATLEKGCVTKVSLQSLDKVDSTIMQDLSDSDNGIQYIAQYAARSRNRRFKELKTTQHIHNLQLILRRIEESAVPNPQSTNVETYQKALWMMRAYAMITTISKITSRFSYSNKRNFFKFLTKAVGEFVPECDTVNVQDLKLDLLSDRQLQQLSPVVASITQKALQKQPIYDAQGRTFFQRVLAEVLIRFKESSFNLQEGIVKHMNKPKAEGYMGSDMIYELLKPVCEAASALHTLSLVYNTIIPRHLRWIESCFRLKSSRVSPDEKPQVPDTVATNLENLNLEGDLEEIEELDEAGVEEKDGSFHWSRACEVFLTMMNSTMNAVEALVPLRKETCTNFIGTFKVNTVSVEYDLSDKWMRNPIMLLKEHPNVKTPQDLKVLLEVISSASFAVDPLKEACNAMIANIDHLRNEAAIQTIPSSPPVVGVLSSSQDVPRTQVQLSELMTVKNYVDYSSAQLHCETIAFSLIVSYKVLLH